jgi:hypothetical protein
MAACMNREVREIAETGADASPAAALERIKSMR